VGCHATRTIDATTHRRLSVVARSTLPEVTSPSRNVTGHNAVEQDLDRFVVPNGDTFVVPSGDTARATSRPEPHPPEPQVRRGPLDRWRACPPLGGERGGCLLPRWSESMNYVIVHVLAGAEHSVAETSTRRLRRNRDVSPCMSPDVSPYMSPDVSPSLVTGSRLNGFRADHGRRIASTGTSPGTLARQGARSHQTVRHRSCRRATAGRQAEHRHSSQQGRRSKRRSSPRQRRHVITAARIGHASGPSTGTPRCQAALRSPLSRCVDPNVDP